MKKYGLWALISCLSLPTHSVQLSKLCRVKLPLGSRGIASIWIAQIGHQKRIQMLRTHKIETQMILNDPKSDEAKKEEARRELAKIEVTIKFVDQEISKLWQIPEPL